MPVSSLRASLPLAALLLAQPVSAQPVPESWRRHAENVTIERDTWGIAHVHGRTDADAVFGMMHAQGEDDFNRIETNYLTSLGRLSEAEGETALWQDLRQRLFVDEADLRRDYARSPQWLRDLMQAWADGLNHFLATHPEVKPRVIARFEPWMALSFTEGSIGGDIERAPLSQLQNFYGGAALAMTDLEAGVAYREPQGSNGFAIAPSHTKGGHALLLINPHTSFFFRSEMQVTSDAGLDVYGAATWGQFFIYQGFNRHIGFMHTSSGVDNVDEFAETIVRKAGKLYYRYGGVLRPVTARSVSIGVRQPDGSLKERRFTTYATHHGPIVRSEGGRWIAFALMNRPLPALEQSFLRTRATDLRSFLEVAERKANSSNNTIFADDKGEIAYLHPQFVPIRDDRFDYRRPVDGSDPATDWRGLHGLDSLPTVIDPGNGWVMNTNNWPWTAAGADSPERARFPRYMDQAGENPRGPHAEMLLGTRRDFTMDSLRAAAYDSYLTAFARLLPRLRQAYEALPEKAAEREALLPMMRLLAGWDYRWSLDSTATTAAVFWGEALWPRVAADAAAADRSPWDYAAEGLADAAMLEALGAARDRLVRDFGRIAVPWGEVNRFQRVDGAIRQRFSDDLPSIPIPFTASQWGSLAAFGARPADTRRRYGGVGNSFVAIVEFGATPRAMAVTVGGQSGNPRSPHFNDQINLYANGQMRPVWLTAQERAAHLERSYRPGDESDTPLP